MQVETANEQDEISDPVASVLEGAAEIAVGSISSAGVTGLVPEKTESGIQ